MVRPLSCHLPPQNKTVSCGFVFSGEGENWGSSNHSSPGDWYCLAGRISGVKTITQNPQWMFPRWFQRCVLLFCSQENYGGRWSNLICAYFCELCGLNHQLDNKVKLRPMIFHDCPYKSFGGNEPPTDHLKWTNESDNEGGVLPLIDRGTVSVSQGQARVTPVRHWSRGTSFSLSRGFPMFAVNLNVWCMWDVDEMSRFVYLDDVGWSETRWYGRSWLDLLNRLFSYTYSEEKLVKRVKLGFQKSSARDYPQKTKGKAEKRSIWKRFPVGKQHVFEISAIHFQEIWMISCCPHVIALTWKND